MNSNINGVVVDLILKEEIEIIFYGIIFLFITFLDYEVRKNFFKINFIL